MYVLQAFLLTVFPALTIIAALTDAVTFTIPNRISLLLLFSFFPTIFALGLPLQVSGINLAIGAAALAVGIGMFTMGWIGGGDAKLFAASALWLGLPAMTTFLLVTAVAGGGLAVLLLNMRSPLLKPFLAGAPPWLSRLVTPGESVPYGVAIAVGALVAFPQSSLMHAFHGSF